jgi:4-amino-4-deoxy-L-arabinose transferase-like glycosyltransferase
MNFTFPVKKDWVRAHTPEILLGLLVVITIVFNIVWIRTDNILGADEDSKVYFARTIVFMDQLRTEGFEDFWMNLQDLSLLGRPVLYQVMAMPIIAVFGRSMDAGLVLNLFFQVLLLVSVYQMGKLLSGPWAGLLATMLVAVYPPLVQLSRLFKPYYAEDACIGFSLWMMLLLFKAGTVRNAWQFILSLGFGTLIHPKFVPTLLIPVTVALVYLVFFQTEPKKPSGIRDFWPWVTTKLKDKLVVLGLLPSLLVVGSMVAAWYFSVGLKLLEILTAANSSELAEFRGYEVFASGFPDVPKNFLWYLLTMPGGISNVFTILFAAGFAAAILKHRSQDWMLVLTFAGMYIYNATTATLAWMYFAQLLPVVALISVIWITELKLTWLRSALVGVLLLSGVFVYSIVTWGVSDRTTDLALWLGAPIKGKGVCSYAGQIFCPVPPGNADWKITEVIEAVINDPGCQPEKCSLLVLKTYGSEFSPNAFNYYKVTQFPESSLTFPRILGSAFDLNPFDFEALLQSQYIVYIDTMFTFKSYNGVAVHFIQNAPNSFETAHKVIGRFDLPGNPKAVLIKRVSLLKLKEAQDAIQAIELDEKYKTGQYRVLAPLYFQEGNLNKALETYQRALQYEPKDPTLYFGLAEVFADLDKPGQAAIAYQQVIALAPGTDMAALAQAWLDSHPR